MAVRISVIIVSDVVYLDQARDKLRSVVEEVVKSRRLGEAVFHHTPNDKLRLRLLVLKAALDSDIIIVAGGTGPAPRDISVEAVRPLLDKEIMGMGEMFRHVSEKEVGVRAYLSRATAGVLGDSLIFVVPGSPNAVRTLLEEIIAPLLEEEGLEMIRGESHWREGGLILRSNINEHDAIVVFKHGVSRPRALYTQVVVRGYTPPIDKVREVLEMVRSRRYVEASALVAEDGGKIGLIFSFSADEHIKGLKVLLEVLETLLTVMREAGG